MGFLFEKLRAYQESLRVSQEIIRLTDHAPRGTSEIVDQLRRAAMSIPANLAEGSGRWHPGDRKQFFWIARASVNECIPHMQHAVSQNILSASDYLRLRQSLDLIGKMITRLIASVKPIASKK